MAGKRSPTANLQINEIGEFLTKVHRVNGLVEQYATARQKPEMYEMAIRRGFQQLKLQFMGAGYDAISQLCGAMETAMKRGGSQQFKSRILREGIGSIRFQLELSQRTIAADDVAAQNRQAEAEAAKDQTAEG
jgi:hypothetical protein